jgi:hypothetical protein
MKITQEDTTAFEQWLNTPIDWDATGKPITNLSAMKHYRPIPDEETGIINYSSIMFAFTKNKFPVAGFTQSTEIRIKTIF